MAASGRHRALTPLHISGVTTDVDPHPGARGAIVSAADGQAQATRHCSTPWAASKFQRVGDMLTISQTRVFEGPTEAHVITSSSSKLKECWTQEYASGRMPR